MGIVSRYFLYLLDCLVMLLVLGIQMYLFYGEGFLQSSPDTYLERLLGDYGPAWLWSVLLGAAYWLIVDYHPVLAGRRGRVVDVSSGHRPSLDKRVLRSLLKALTLFGATFLLLFALFSKDHRLLHDYVAGTDRLKVR
ncbi:hypothetical protein LEM8419_03012 [Neolewinella maritima]|uniref:RDD domain-containing protein n=1 Tax=Neolewinella maritima TaxID=1383882 RepID=A0ABM9B4B9_9BACT|nr:RDD family protein [Neolewinella maritima]CAH1002095.1 hypothetical protein LEM8419_03012 [Neolewinella maritima]